MHSTYLEMTVDFGGFLGREVWNKDKMWQCKCKRSEYVWRTWRGVLRNGPEMAPSCAWAAILEHSTSSGFVGEGIGAGRKGRAGRRYRGSEARGGDQERGHIERGKREARGNGGQEREAGGAWRRAKEAHVLQRPAVRGEACQATGVIKIEERSQIHLRFWISDFSIRMCTLTSGSVESFAECICYVGCSWRNIVPTTYF